MSRVFVVQNHLRLDPATQEFVPRYNISPAAQFGEIVYLLPPRTSASNPASVIDRLTDALRDFRDSDYLLLIGHPCFIGWAVAIAAARNRGRVRSLVWSSGRYVVVEATLPIQMSALTS